MVYTKRYSFTLYHLGLHLQDALVKGLYVSLQQEVFSPRDELHASQNL